jgi:ABC-2 type transport system permease protein
MVGLGHGGLESMILGATTALSVAALLGLRGTDVSTLDLTTEQLAALQSQFDVLSGSPLVAFLPFVERLAAMTLHIAASLLVWLAFRRRQPLYVLAAVLYHALVDATAVYAGQFIDNPWLLEGIILLMALPGAAFVVWTYRRYGADATRHTPPSWRSEWGAYLTLLRKELLELWRTRKALVVLVVFLLFGLTSPLLARFVTEIIMSVPGAEEFAGLIPEPRAADAVAQFIENITQFGFIMTLLLCMGLIAGEKERGTAAMILSKPAPRWAFVLSKFDALALIYLPALLIAGLGAGYYTNQLFDPGLTLGPFLLGVLLLWLWLMAIAALVLLGSALGRTTLMGAGLGLLVCVALFIVGAFPQPATLLPSGLVMWAAQLGVPEPVPINGWGALAGTLVLILFCLVAAVGVVERQEV